MTNHTDTSRSGELVKWLREEASFAYHRAEEDMLTGAADCIEALEAENERLRLHLDVALETLAEEGVCGDECNTCNEARAALGEKQ